MTPSRSGVEVEIDAPANRVWSLLTEFPHWPEWGPTVRAVESEVGAVAPGVTGRVQTIIGPWLRFEIEGFESGHYWDWSVGGIRATGQRVTPLSGDRTRVVFSVPRLFLPYRWVLARGLRKLKKIAEVG